MSEAVKLDTRILDKLTVELRPKVKAAVDKSAFRVESKAKQGSPLKTGANRNSGYTNTGNGSNYSQSASSAKSANPGAVVDSEIQPPDDMTDIVGFSMEYSLWLEIGTGKMAARPYLVPAVESEEKELTQAIKDAFK